MLNEELQQRIEKLSPVQRLLLAQRLAQRGNDDAPARHDAQRSTAAARLVAFVAPHEGRTISGETLRGYLRERLPDYMVPTECVVLSELPHLPNGKLDRGALAKISLAKISLAPFSLSTKPNVDASTMRPQPTTSAVAETLRSIWADVLGFDEIEPNDNFFEVGGDSILSIQIVARAAKAGIRLSPTQIFDHPTIAELAQTVEAAAIVAAPSKQTTAQIKVNTEEVIITPIQHWLLEQNLTAPQQWNQSLLLQTPSALDSGKIEQALNHLLHHHDALRLQFEQRNNGWRQFDGGKELRLKLHRHDLGTVADGEIQHVIDLHATKLHAGFSLSGGALVAAAHFDCGSARPGYLLLVVHHLVIDAVSWSILLEDLATVYQQLTHDKPPVLTANLTQFQQWTEALKVAAQSESMRSELPHWRRLAQSTNATLPLDFANSDPQRANQNQSQQTVSVALTGEATRTLLQESATAYNTQVNDLLLAALARTISRWIDRPSLLFGMEGHGREQLAANLDPSRLVGWITSYFPVELTVERDASPATLIKGVKEQLRQTPNRGIGYGLLRYLSDDATVRSELSALQSPPLLFNYLGQMDRQQQYIQPFAIAQFGVGQQRHPADLRPVLIEINARIEGGQLRLEWSYSENLHHRQTIEQLATDYCEALNDLISHCATVIAPTFTPSDFPLAQIEQSDLDAIVAQTNAPICDLYPLSPMQELMLVATASTTHSNLLVTQARYRLRGQVDVARLQAAWQTLVERHPALRTGFVWQGLRRPLQFVQRAATLPFTVHDLGDLGAAEQERNLYQLRQLTHQQHVSLSSPPLMRLTLLRLNAEEYEMLWDCHHLVVDRWCNGILLRELLTLYDAATQGKPVDLPSPAPFADYVAWLQQQSPSEAEQFWRGQIGQSAQPSLLADVRPSGSTGKPAIGEASTRIATEQLLRLRQFARSQNLTLSTLIHGAWLLLLGRYCGRREVITGITVSGRPASLPGVEAMIGSFINNLPLAVEIVESGTLIEWLSGLQRQMATIREFDTQSLAAIHNWSQIPAHLPLFDTLLVFQNADPLASDSPMGLTIEEEIGSLETNYPFTLAIAEVDDQLLLRAAYHADCFSASTMAGILDDLSHVLMAIVADSAIAPSIFAERMAIRHVRIHRAKTIEPPLPASPTVTDSSLSAMEREMTAIWCDLLRLPHVDPTESYFDLGGSSLQAMHLFTRMNQHFGTNLSLTTLIHAPTIRQLAQVMGDRTLETGWTPIVPLQTAGALPPFFCVHGLTGDVLWFRELGRCLAPEQPLYGIQAYGLEREQQPLPSIEEMATSYISAMKKIQPQGPYFFGGASFGGTVALEMAQQLSARGEWVGLLVMFDHAPPFSETETQSTAARIRAIANIVSNAPRWAQSMSALGWGSLFARFRRKLRILGKRLLDSSGSTAAADLLDYGDQLPVHRQQLIEANASALLSYCPQPFSGKITLFQANAQPLLSKVRPAAVWQSFSGKAIDVEIIPGSHEGIFRSPNVEKLAHSLRRRIQAAVNEKRYS